MKSLVFALAVLFSLSANAQQKLRVHLRAEKIADAPVVVLDTSVVATSDAALVAILAKKKLNGFTPEIFSKGYTKQNLVLTDDEGTVTKILVEIEISNPMLLDEDRAAIPTIAAPSVTSETSMKVRVVVKDVESSDIELFNRTAPKDWQTLPRGQKVTDITLSNDGISGEYTFKCTFPAAGAASILLINARGEAIFRENVTGKTRHQTKMPYTKQGTLVLGIKYGDEVTLRRVVIE